MVDYQLKDLAFVHNGAILLQSAQIKSTESNGELESVVVGWNLSNATLKYTCRGSLKGVARDGSTFLTVYSVKSTNGYEKRVSLWESATGTEIALASVDPDSYPIHQRSLISSQYGSHLKLQIDDVFNQFPPAVIELTRYSSFDLDIYVMTPNNRYLILSLSGDMDGFEWTDGWALEIVANTTGIAESGETHSIHVGRGVPELSFSEEHNLMAVARVGSFTLYNLEPWQKIGNFNLERINSGNKDGVEVCNHIGFNPQNKWFFAASTTKPGKTYGDNTFSIHLLDFKQGPLKDGDRYGHEKGVIEETGSIKNLLFHPNGHYLASLLKDGSLHLWDTKNCQLVADLSMP